MSNTTQPLESNMNNEPDEVLDNDNGIISIALQVYANWAQETSGDYKGNTSLIDRARELSIIFRDMDSTHRYE